MAISVTAAATFGGRNVDGEFIAPTEVCIKSCLLGTTIGWSLSRSLAARSDSLRGWLAGRASSGLTNMSGEWLFNYSPVSPRVFHLAAMVEIEGPVATADDNYLGGP